MLARAGIGSRRKCEELISAGRVRINGRVAVLGDKVTPDVDHVEIDGSPVVIRDDLVYYLVNKPTRVVSTSHDPEGRTTVLDLVPAEPRVFPVGRLDWDTEGLLIVTNDGELTNLLTHPSHGVEKQYLAEVEGVPTRATLRALRDGVDLADGRTAPAQASLAQQRAGGAAVTIVIHEGRNRQVRRMLDAVGHPVRRLVRTRIGPIADRSLAPGEWRVMTPDEVRLLYAAATHGK